MVIECVIGKVDTCFIVFAGSNAFCRTFACTFRNRIGSCLVAVVADCTTPFWLTVVSITRDKSDSHTAAIDYRLIKFAEISKWFGMDVLAHAEREARWHLCLQMQMQ